MKFEMILIGAGIIIGILILVSSKFMRTVSKEAMMHPREECEIRMKGNNISVNRFESEPKAED